MTAFSLEPCFLSRCDSSLRSKCFSFTSTRVFVFGLVQVFILEMQINSIFFCLQLELEKNPKKHHISVLKQHHIFFFFPLKFYLQNLSHVSLVSVKGNRTPCIWDAAPAWPETALHDFTDRPGSLSSRQQKRLLCSSAQQRWNQRGPGWRKRGREDLGWVSTLWRELQEEMGCRTDAELVVFSWWAVSSSILTLSSQCTYTRQAGVCLLCDAIMIDFAVLLWVRIRKPECWVVKW